MLPCPSCERHVRPLSRDCPFCETPIRWTTPGTRARAVLVIATGVALSACGPAISDMGDMIDSSSSSSSSSATPTSDASTMNTGSTTGGVTTNEVTTSIDDTGEFSTTDATVGSSTLNDDTFDTCGGFYGGCPADAGVEPYECDVVAQDCARDEKCMPWANDGGAIWNATRCTPIDGDDEPGEPCTVEGSGVSGIDSCVFGAMCFNVDPDSNEGICEAMCGGEFGALTCAGEVECSEVIEGTVLLCLDQCDPLGQACPDNQGCYAVPDGFACLATTAEAAAGEPCEQITGCTPGTLCVPSDFVDGCRSAQCCTPLCDTNEPNCEAPATCEQIYENIDGPGICVAPS